MSHGVGAGRWCALAAGVLALAGVWFLGCVGDEATVVLSDSGTGGDATMGGMDAAGNGGDASGIDSGGGATDAGTTDAGIDAGPPGTIQWVKTFGGTGSEGVNSMALAPSGDLVFVGDFSSPDVNFGCTKHAVLAGGRDSYIVELDSTGACKWVTTFGGAGDDFSYSVAVSPVDGAVYVGSSTTSAAPTIGGTVVTASPSDSGSVTVGLLTKLSPTGTHVWSRVFSGSGDYSTAWAVAVSKNNLVVVGGVMNVGVGEAVVVHGASATLTIPSATNVARGYGYVATYSAAGEPQFGRITRTSTNDGDTNVFRVAVDDNEDIAMIGTLNSPSGTYEDQLYPTVGGGIKSTPDVGPPAGEEIFIAKVQGPGGGGNIGKAVWARVWGSTVSDIEPQSLVADKANHIGTMVGALGGLDFGGGTQAAPAMASSVAFASYSAGGTLDFGKQFASQNGGDYGSGLAYGPNETVFIFGTMAGAVDFGNGALPYAGQADAFLASFDSKGVVRWSQSFGGAGNDTAVTGVATAQGTLLVGGKFDARVNIAGKQYDTNGTADLVLMSVVQ